MMSQQKAIKLIVSAQQHLKDIYNEKIPAIAYSDRNMAISCLTQARAELADQPVCDTCGGTHYLDKDDNPVAINTNSPGWKHCPNCKQPPAGEFTPKKNYIEDYLSKTRYRLTTGTRDEEMDKFARWFLEACTLLDQQAERIEQLEVSLKIAVDYVKNPNSRRTLEGQLKDIETGHY